MSILHLVRSSAFDKQDFQQCLNTLLPQDCLVLLDDGCYNINHPLFKQITIDVEINVLARHADARAVEFVEHAKAINMADLVKITFAHQTVITWQ